MFIVFKSLKASEHVLLHHNWLAWVSFVSVVDCVILLTPNPLLPLTLPPTSSCKPLTFINIQGARTQNSELESKTFCQVSSVRDYARVWRCESLTVRMWECNELQTHQKWFYKKRG
jgi:hypothetical protein